jgi:uncharacterized membrane protein required for colicin V production
LNKVDVILIIIILIPTYIGFKKGFLKSIFSLIGIIAGLILATMFHTSLIPFFKIFIRDNRIINLVSFLIILIAVYFIIIFIAIRISRINQVTKTLDKISGLFLGFIKGVIAASLIGFIFFNFNVFSEITMRGSVIYNQTEQIPIVLYKFIISTFKNNIPEFEFKKLIPIDTLK